VNDQTSLAWKFMAMEFLEIAIARGQRFATLEDDSL